MPQANKHLVSRFRNTVKLHQFDAKGEIALRKSDGVIRSVMLAHDEIRTEYELKQFLGEFSMPNWIRFEWAICAWVNEQKLHVGLKLHVNSEVSIDIATQWHLPITASAAISKARRMFSDAFDSAIDTHLQRDGMVVG
jgi:hypothetical protein